jgi:glycosyltransferase involved in cell wall biosynthesis
LAVSLPKVSVVVAVFNGVEYAERCIASYARQDYPYKELIVVDGGSTDGTSDVLNANAQHITRCISENDRGLYHALNKGIAQASGDWYYFLGIDDYILHPDVLGRVAHHLEGIPDAVRVAYGRVVFVNQSGDTLAYVGKPWDLSKKRFRQCMSIPHQGVFHRKELFDIHGPFSEAFAACGDYEFLLRELKDRDAYFMPDIEVAAYQFGGGSSVPEHSLGLLLDFRRAQRRNGIRFPGSYWALCLVKALARNAVLRLMGDTMGRRTLDAIRTMFGYPRFWTRT